MFIWGNFKVENLYFLFYNTYRQVFILKTIRFLVLILLGYFVFTPFVSAACDAAKKVQLDRDVASIKVNYEILKEAYSGRTDVTNTNEEETFYYDVIQVNIINVTEDFMVEVKSDYDKKTTKYTYKDAKDGIISLSYFLAYPTI